MIHERHLRCVGHTWNEIPYIRQGGIFPLSIQPRSRVSGVSKLNVFAFGWILWLYLARWTQELVDLLPVEPWTVRTLELAWLQERSADWRVANSTGSSGSAGLVGTFWEAETPERNRKQNQSLKQLKCWPMFFPRAWVHVRVGARDPNSSFLFLKSSLKFSTLRSMKTVITSLLIADVKTDAFRHLRWQDFYSAESWSELRIRFVVFTLTSIWSRSELNPSTFAIWARSF